MLPVLRTFCLRNSLKSLQQLPKRQHLSNLCPKLKSIPLSTMTAATNLQTIRFKMKKHSRPQQEVSESSSEETSDEDDDSDKHSKAMKINVATMRVDAVLKTALGISRNKIDMMFYENRIRINGEKIPKKNVPVREGDEVDLIKAVCPLNPENLTVARVEVLKAIALTDKIVLKIRRCKSLTVENYGGIHSWKG